MPLATCASEDGDNASALSKHSSSRNPSFSENGSVSSARIHEDPNAIAGLANLPLPTEYVEHNFLPPPLPNTPILPDTTHNDSISDNNEFAASLFNPSSFEDLPQQQFPSNLLNKDKSTTTVKRRNRMKFADQGVRANCCLFLCPDALTNTIIPKTTYINGKITQTVNAKNGNKYIIQWDTNKLIYPHRPSDFQTSIEKNPQVLLLLKNARLEYDKHYNNNTVSQPHNSTKPKSKQIKPSNNATKNCNKSNSNTATNANIALTNIIMLPPPKDMSLHPCGSGELPELEDGVIIDNMPALRDRAMPEYDSDSSSSDD